MSASADLAIAIRVLGDAERDIRGLGSEMRALGGHVASAAPSFNLTAGAIAAGTLAANAMMTAVGGLVGIFKASATAGSEFSQSMANIKATLPKADFEQFGGQLESLALKLGKDYPLSASEAGKAMEMLAQKGISAKDIMNGGAEAVVKLSSATGGDLVTSAGIAAAALDTFGLNADDLGKATDVMTAAVLRGGMSVEDFGHALQAGGATVALAGGSIDDLSLALAAMAKAGIEGADAGTSIKTMYTALVPSTKAAKDAMIDLGLMTKKGANAFFDAEGNAKSYEEISRLLAEATKDLTAEEKIKTFQTIFGSDAQRAASVAAQLGAGAYGDLAGAMREQGIAAAAAAAKNDSLKGDVNSLTGSWETLQVVLFRRVEPALRAVTQRVNSLLGVVLDFAQSDAFTDTLNEIGTVVQDVSDWLLNLGISIVDFSIDVLGKIPVVGETFRIVGTIIGTAVSTVAELLIGNFGGALDQVTEGTSDLMERSGDIWDTIKTTVQSAVNTMIAVFGPLVAWMAERIPGALRWLANTGWPLLTSAMSAVRSFVVGTLVPSLLTVWTWLADKLPPVLDWLIDVGWPKLLDAVKAASSFFTNTVVPALTTLIGWLKDKVPPAVMAVLDAFEAVKSKLAPVVEAIFSGDLKTALSKLGSAFAEFATLALGWLGDQVAKIDWDAVWKRAVDVVKAMGQWFVSAATTVAGWIGDQVAKIDWSDVWKKAVNVVSNMAQWFSDAASKLYGWIADEVAKIDWKEVWKKAKDVASNMAQWFTDAAGKLAGWISTEVAKIDWQAVWSKAVDVATSMGQWFVGAVTLLAGWISDQVAAIDWAAIWATAKDVASSMAQWFLTTATDFATWIGERVAEIDWPTVWSQAKDMAAAMQAAFAAEAAKIDWQAVLAANVNASQQMWTWLNDTVAKIDWATLGQAMGGFLVNAAIDAFMTISPVGLAIRLGSWISDAIGAPGEGGIDWSTLGSRFANGVAAMIVAIETSAVIKAIGDFFYGLFQGAWDAAMQRFKPTMPNLGGPVTSPTSGREPMGLPTGGIVPPSSVPPPSTANLPPIDNSSRAAFVRTAWPYMLEAAGGDRALAEMMLAKAISENGDIGKGGGFIGNNFSGIKGVGSAGSFEAMTWEMENGRRVNQMAKFAAYKTPQEGFAAFGEFLKNNSRYSSALEGYRQSGDVRQLFRDINTAGYATDPDWADKVENIRKNQVEPITSGLQGLTVANKEAQASWQLTQETLDTLGPTFKNIDEAVVSVTASLFREHGQLRATGSANADLARDALPTINMLQQQGAISAETAEQLRQMALDVLGVGQATTTAEPALNAAQTAVAGIGTAAVTTDEGYIDLSRTIRNNRLTPTVNATAVENLNDLAVDTKTDLLAVDDTPIAPRIDTGGITEFQDLVTDIGEVADITIHPTIDATGLDEGIIKVGDLTTGLAASDDTVVTPQVVKTSIDLANTATDTLGRAVQGLNQVGGAPQVNATSIDAAYKTTGELGSAVQGLNAVGGAPQVDAGSIEHAVGRAGVLDSTLVGVDEFVTEPLVNAGLPSQPPSLEYAISRAGELDQTLDDASSVHTLVVGAGGLPSAPEVDTINVDNDIRVKDKIGAQGAVFGGSPIISPGFQFNFARGGRPPLGVASLVGELGPELFMPDQAGTILPADVTAGLLSGDAIRGGAMGAMVVSGGGGGGTTVVVNVSGNTMLGRDRRVAQELARIIKPELDRQVRGSASSYAGVP